MFGSSILSSKASEGNRMVGDRFIATLKVFLGFQIAQAGMVEVLAI
jgi:hypothetical protein